MSTNPAVPAVAILNTFSRLVERQLSGSTHGLALGQVTNPRPNSPMVRIQGYEEETDVLLPDWFNLVPLVRGDLVTLGQLPGGDWIVLTRLATGSIAGIDIPVDLDQLTAPVLQLGSPYTDDGDESPGKFQSASLASRTWAAGTVTPVTWTYPDAYTAAPVVAAAIVSASASAWMMGTGVSACDEVSATFQILNAHTAGIAAGLNFFSVGPV